MTRILFGVIFLILIDSIPGFTNTTFTLFVDRENRDFVSEIKNPNIKKEDIEALFDVLGNQKKPAIIKGFTSGIYAFQSCSFDVFKLLGGKWINLYKGGNNGFNCFPKIFEHNGIIYSLGSYGYWKKHSTLLFFKENTGEWEFLPTNNMPENYSSGFFAQNDGVIYQFFGEYVNEAANIKIKEAELGYKLEIDKREWEKGEINILEYISPNQFDNDLQHPYFDLDDYSVFTAYNKAEKGFMLFEKATNQFYFLSMRNNDLDKSAFYYYTKNELIFFDLEFGLTSIDFSTRDKVLLGDFREMAIKKNSKQLIINFLIILIVGLVLILLTVKRVFNRKQSLKGKEFDQFQDELSVFISRLMDLSGQTIGTDLLDEIIEINGIHSPENKRGRRSKIINGVNLKYRMIAGKDLIVRVKNEKDKRLVSYHISKHP